MLQITFYNTFYNTLKEVCHSVRITTIMLICDKTFLLFYL